MTELTNKLSAKTQMTIQKLLFAEQVASPLQCSGSQCRAFQRSMKI